MTTDILINILKNPWALALVVIFFGASIFIHELGHYLAARWRGLKIERFSIGFGPRIFGWTDRRGVDWRISLIPLGGYVALPQIGNLSQVEGEAGTQQLPSISYADKMIVSVAGAVFNVLFALGIGSVLWAMGTYVDESQETRTVGMVVENMRDNSGSVRQGPAYRAGIQPGDQIIEIDGRTIQKWEDILYGITTGSGRSEHGSPMTDLLIERNGEQISKTLFPLLDEHERIRRVGIIPANTLLVGGTFDNSPAEIAGLEKGDIITHIDGEQLFHTGRFARIIQERPTDRFELTVKRGDEVFTTYIAAEEVVFNQAGDTRPMIGVMWQPVRELQHIGPFQQVNDAFTLTTRILGALINPRTDVGISNLSGPVGIGYTIYIFSQIGIRDVLAIVLLININLAILNLLPIPVLDGGHMVIATIEKLRRKPVPTQLIASAQGVFMLLFLALFVYVTFFDVGRVQRSETAIIEAERAAQQQVPLEFGRNGENGSEE